MPISLLARYVFPVDRPPIEHGVVTLDGERIVAVGATPEGGGRTIDLGEVALLPGLVNAHTHLEFSHLTRPLGENGLPLADWIRQVISQRGQRGNDPLHAIQAGVRESLQHGVTTLGDISTADSTEAYGQCDATLFLEVIGFSRARADATMAAVTTRLEAFESHGGVRAGLSPHAPYTVSPDLLKRLIELARHQNLPVAMHVGESADEIEFLRTGQGAFQKLLDERSMWDSAAIPHGSRPLDYLKLLAAAPRSLVIHGNYLENDEHAFLAAHRDRMSLVYCPRTHAYFAHPPYPLAALLASGVSVALGTDSLASNPDLDLLAEMRHIARHCPAINPQEILQLGTLAGATALGRNVDVGSITPGKFANMIALSVARGCRTKPDEVVAELLLTNAALSAVWYRGRRL